MTEPKDTKIINSNFLAGFFDNKAMQRKPQLRQDVQMTLSKVFTMSENQLKVSHQRHLTIISQSEQNLFGHSVSTTLFIAEMMIRLRTQRLSWLPLFLKAAFSLSETMVLGRRGSLQAPFGAEEGGSSLLTEKVRCQATAVATTAFALALLSQLLPYQALEAQLGSRGP